MTTRVIQPTFDVTIRMRPIRIAKNCKSVRRQLFGPVDHENTRRLLEAEWKKDQRLGSMKWNFDFDKDEPKQDPGRRYEWEKVSKTFAPRRPKLPQSEPDITEYYPNLPVRVQNQPSQKEIEDGIQEQDIQKNEEKKSKSKQTKISDFMVIRKRNSDSISATKTTESVIPPPKISKYNC
ncbi:hypothetical protein Trydic_g7531 [Trypoxylus dichotomus]